MKNYPLVSIVTLSYKRFDYIYDTIKSVLMQDYPNIEYIIADDGSDNFPAEEIEEFVYKNKRDNIKNFTILHNETNVGTVKNLNSAYTRAEGEYLMPLSTDDVFCSRTVVRRIINLFLEKQCDAVVGGRVICDESLNPVYFIPHILDTRNQSGFRTSKQQYFAFIEERFYKIMSGSVLYLRKSKWEQLGGFDESYKLLEDAPFFEKYLWENRLEIAYQIRAIYYRTGGVSTGIANPQLVKDAERYNVIQKKTHIDSFSKRTIKVLEYADEFVGNTGFSKRIRVYLRHPIIFCTRVIYKVKCRIKIKYDRIMIKKGYRSKKDHRSG